MISSGFPASRATAARVRIFEFTSWAFSGNLRQTRYVFNRGYQRGASDLRAGESRVTRLKWMVPVLVLVAACADVPDDTLPPEPVETVQSNPGFGGIEGLERPAAEFEVLEACLEESQKLLVGQPVAQARLTLPATARIIGPDDIYVQDYRPERLNAEGIVTRLWCG